MGSMVEETEQWWDGLPKELETDIEAAVDAAVEQNSRDFP